MAAGTLDDQSPTGPTERVKRTFARPETIVQVQHAGNPIPTQKEPPTMASFFNKPTATNPTTPVVPTPTQERGPTLAELESVIAAGLDTVEQVGRSLLQIKVRRLFLDTHATWEEYLEARWKMSFAYAHKLI
ncbi:MAG: hypothetical protein ACK52S_20045 [Pirellula sp.]